MTAVSERLQAAVQHHQAGELDQAESLYNEIVRIDPGHADALHLLGVAAHQREQHEEAIQYIRRAIEINGSAALYHSNLGACYRALGRLSEAEMSLREAIRLAPRFAGAHYNLGMTLEALDRREEAIRSYREALSLEPDFLDAWNNLGNACLALGRTDEAIDSYRSILELAPDAADIHYNLANALERKGDLEQAEASYRDALRFNPRHAQAYNNLGTVLKDRQRLDEAVACFDKAIALQPGYTEPALNRAAALKARAEASEKAPIPLNGPQGLCARARALEIQGRLDDARDLYQQALQLEPDYAPALFGVGFAHLSAGRHDEARAAYTRGLEIDPQNAPAWNNLGSIYASHEEWADAVRCYRQAIEIDPQSAKAHYNLGNVHKDLWELDEAVACYRRAIECDPSLAEAHINLGVVLQHQGDLDGAVESHNVAIALRPGDAEARFHRAQTLLARGDFDVAWDEYESRWEYEAAPRGFPQPVWDGRPLGEQSLLIYAEQGIGDEILFASCLPDVLGLARECCVECDRRLVSLLARSFPLAKVVARPDGRDLPADPAALKCDRQIAMGSLPKLVRRSLAAFPRQRRFLIPDGDRVDAWRARLAALGKGLKVGVSWRGGHSPAVRQRRSIGLDRWRPILSVPGAHFISLQYGDCAEELEQFRSSTEAVLHAWPEVDPLTDLEGFAAQIAALDLVISVDNSTVHMAGALGVPVWTLLHFSPNWRWMRDRDDSCWYSSVRLFRQPELGDWNSVIERVAEELHQHARSGRVAAFGKTNLRVFSGTRICDADDDEGFEAPRAGQPLPRLHDPDAEREKEKYEKAWTIDAYRKFSPGLAALDQLPLIDMLRQHGVRTILDAGCGSGKMMQRLMTEYGSEFEVHGFDISENCLDPFFDDVRDQVLTVGCLWNPDDFRKQYDAVFCTDVMEHIPTIHVPAVLANLRRSTRKVAYFSISVQADRFGPQFFGEPLHLTIRRPNWWFAQLALAGYRVTGYTTANDSSGEEAQLHVFLTV